MTKELKVLLESNGISESQLVGKELDIDVDATGRLEEVTCMAEELGLTVDESEEEHLDALQLLSISGDAITVLTFLYYVLKKIGPSFVTMVRTTSDIVVMMKVVPIRTIRFTSLIPGVSPVLPTVALTMV